MKNGIKFKGCNFQNNGCPESMTAEDNAAIFSSSSGFIVDSYCTQNIIPCPDNYLINSYFNGFYMGVNAVHSGENISSFTIKNAMFSENHIGIRALGSAFPTILFSTYFVDGPGDCSVGIYLDNTSSFTIEDNTFYRGVTSRNTQRIGIAVINSQGVNNIYNNRFFNLDCANYAENQNWVESIYNGLTYSCNSNSGNTCDFYIPSNTNFYGIQSIQGSISMASGNSFSYYSTCQFYNGANYPVRYYQFEDNINERFTS